MTGSRRRRSWDSQVDSDGASIVNVNGTLCLIEKEQGLEIQAPGVGDTIQGTETWVKLGQQAVRAAWALLLDIHVVLPWQIR